jgi:Ca2+-binding EF-hand superfamily protein
MNQHSAALVITNKIRLYSIRIREYRLSGLLPTATSYCTETEKEGRKNVEGGDLSQRRQYREQLITKYNELQATLHDSIAKHSTALKQIRKGFEVKARKSSKILKEKSKKKNESGASLVRRLEDRLVHFNEITNSIQEQQSFIEVLNDKSKVMTENGHSKMDEIEKSWTSLLQIMAWIGNQIDNTVYRASSPHVHKWLSQQNSILTDFISECDEAQESLLQLECRRIEQHSNIIRSSTESLCRMLDCVARIEMWEAERFGLYNVVMNYDKPFHENEVNKFLQLIDNNQMKLNQARKKELPQICEHVGDFYYHKSLDIENHVLIQQDRLKSIKFHRWSTSHYISKLNKKIENLHKCDGMDMEDIQKQTTARLIETQKYVFDRRQLLLSSSTTQMLSASHSKPGKTRYQKRSATNIRSRYLNIRKHASMLVRESIQHIKIVPSITKTTTRNKEDPELRMLKRVVKKSMNNQNNSNIIGVKSLQLTVGIEETGIFNTENNHNEASGMPFFQSRIDLGSHNETVLWVQVTSKRANFVTSIAWRQKDKVDENYQKKEVIGHEKLGCILCIERNENESQIISSIQVTYSNTNDKNILEKDYHMLPFQLQKFGLADAQLWVSYSNRTMQSVSANLDRMRKQLADYEVLLSQSPNDILVKNLFQEMERRIEVIKRQEKEQRGICHDHLGYISDFLALSDADVIEFKKSFNRIDQNSDGFVTVDDLIKILKAPLSIIPVIKACVLLSLGEDKLIHDKLDIGAFARSMASIAMFSSNEIIKCLFCSIDDRGFGVICKDDLFHFLRMLHPNQDIETVTRCLYNTSIPNSVPFDFFRDLAISFPKLLFPIFRFQKGIRKICLGTKWWERKMRKFIDAKEQVLKEETIKTI